MNSNSNASILRIPTNFRETFGITKKNGDKYKDIKSSFLHAQIVTVYDVHKGFLHSPSKDDTSPYVIHCDFETFQRIGNENEAQCIISFQRRTTGNFAMVRLFKKELQNV